MARGRLEPPKLDDRNWQEIRDQAVQLIARYNPEWTDLGPSDPGITIVELFAWLVEGMIWRLDQVPERNFVEFLNLLGITRDPAVPATAWLTFTNATTNQEADAPAGTQAGTVESAAQAAVVFETDEAVVVWPGDLTQSLLVPDSLADPAAFRDVSAAVVRSPLLGLDIDLPPNDPAAAVKGEAILHLGFTARPATGRDLTLHAQVANLDGEPEALPPDEFDLAVTAEYSSPGFKALEAGADGTGGFRRSGWASWKVPADWVSVKRSALTGEAIPPSPDPPLFWLRLRLAATLKATAVARPPRIRLGHLLYNSAPATNAPTFKKPANAPADLTSDGRPFQTIDLAFRPVYKRPGPGFAYDHVAVRVSAAGRTRADAIKWDVATELPSGPATIVRLDPVTGVLEFGDGTRGLIPPAGSQVWVESYRHVAGGSGGNVAPGAVRLLQRPVERILAVTNFGAGQGGTDEEDIEETKRRAPESLNNRDRAVTTSDFEFLAREASNRVRKVRCLPPATTDGQAAATAGAPGRLNRGEGHINVLIVSDAAGPRPLPEPGLIREVQDHLDARRMLTNRVQVVGPRYVPVEIKAEYRLFPPPPGGAPRTADFGPNLRARLLDAVQAYLHPLSGRPSAPGLADGAGWEIGQSLFAFELFDHLKAVLGRDGYLTSMTCDRVTPADTSDSQLGRFTLTADVGVSLADFELICSADRERHSMIDAGAQDGGPT